MLKSSNNQEVKRKKKNKNKKNQPQHYGSFIKTPIGTFNISNT